MSQNRILYITSPYKKQIGEVISILLLLLFLYTGFIKITNLDRFYNELSVSPVIRDLPYSHLFTTLLFVVVPLTEICVACLLFFEKTKKLGFYASLLLMLAFTGYIYFLTTAYDHVPCGCAGTVFNNMSYSTHLVVNISFTIIAIVGCYSTLGSNTEIS
jgi:putative oxidoreductase